jgi:hypothetical protein
MKLFGRTLDPEARVAQIRAQLVTAEAERASARATLGEIVASGDDPSALAAARERVAVTTARLDELAVALPIAEARVVQARERAAAEERERHLSNARRAAGDRLRHARRFDDAVAKLHDAWVAYEASGVEEQQALRAAGQHSGPMLPTSRRRAYSALWFGARPLAHLLQLPYSGRVESLAASSSPDAPPAEGDVQDRPSPAVA